MRRILVIKLADIGDVLTATPALRSLRATFPQAHIAALVTPLCAPLLQSTGLVDNVLPFPKHRFDRLSGVASPGGVRALAGLAGQLRVGRYDTVLLLHHLTTAAGVAKYRALLAATGAPLRAGLDNGRGGFLTHRVPDAGFGDRHEVEYCNAVAALVGAPADLGPLAFPLTDQDRSAAAALLGVGDGRPLAVVHPGAGGFSVARRWPADRFAAVARALQHAGARVVLVGGPDETSLAAQVAAGAAGVVTNLAGQTSLGALGAVLERADVFVGNDSGVTHIAAAVGAPVVAVFGPTNADAWGPWTGGCSVVRVLRSALPCQPCVYRGRSLGTPQGCPARTCLQLVTAHQVADAALDLLRLGRGVAP